MFNKKSIALATLAASGALARSLRQEEERGLMLAIQKPTVVANLTTADLTVSFMTGPSATSGNYTITCLPQDPDLSCDNFGGVWTPWTSPSGDLEPSFTRTRIEAVISTPNAEAEDEVRCFIEAESGLFGMAMKCYDTGVTVFEDPAPARLAGSIIKPDVVATGNGTGEVTFETIGAVEYDYQVSCYNKEALDDLDITLTCNSNFTAAEDALITNEVGTTSKGKSTTTVDVTGTAGDTAQCFVFTEGPMGKLDKCKSAGEAVLGSPQDQRLAGSIIKPDVVATGNGTGEVTFETIGAVEYDYQVSCYDKEALDAADITLTCNSNFTAAEDALITNEVGTTSKGKSTTTVDIGVLDATTAQCFVFTEGPMGKLDKCKSAGEADIPAPDSGRLAGSIIKPDVVATGNGTGEVTFKTIGAVEYDYQVSCFDKEALVAANITLTCDSNFTAAVDARITNEVGTTSKGKSTTTVDVIGTSGNTAQCFVFTEGPMGKLDKCKSAGEAVLGSPQDRLATSVINPQVVFTGPGAGQVSFDTVGAVQYDYLVNCYDTAILASEGVTPTCKMDFNALAVQNAMVVDEAGVTPVGKSSTAVSFSGLVADSVSCFVLTEGPLGKSTCKAAGEAVVAVA